MIVRSSVLVSFLLAMPACSAGGDPGGTGSTGGTGGAPPSTTSCFPGQQACYCPDGTQTGQQTCDGQGQLSPCQCAATPGQPMPPGPGVTKLCPQLAGSRTCDTQRYVSEQVPASILFVVDRSGSMDCNPPPVQTVESCNQVAKRQDPNQPSRWEITVKALNDAFAGLGGTSAAVGLSLFSSDGNCGADSTPVVPLAASSAVQLSALSEAMNVARPAGGTPVVGGVVTAYHHLHEQAKAAGNRYVVLITDGEESCGTKGNEADKADLEVARKLLLNTEVKKARDANIRTFVIGAPGSEGARGFLSELAFQGGTARAPNCLHGESTAGDCHFDLSTQADFAQVLRDSLGKISGRALGCEFKAPSGDASKLNVQTSQNGGDPTCLARTEGACEGGASGWQFAKTAAGADDFSRIVLCGGACDQVTADATSAVDVILGCGTIR